MREVYSTNNLPDNAVISTSRQFNLLHKNPKYQLYTQVDAGRSVAYVKGRAFVNRTGIYALIPKRHSKYKLHSSNKGSIMKMRVGGKNRIVFIPSKYGEKRNR